MTAEIVNVAEGILTLRISGRLSPSELAKAQAEADRIVQSQGTLGVLVVAENFNGWERGTDWGDSPNAPERDARNGLAAV